MVSELALTGRHASLEPVHLSRSLHTALLSRGMGPWGPIPKS